MTDVVSLALPICAVDVARLIGGKRQAVAAQVNAQFSISDAIPPYFDFSLHFEVALPPFGTAVFLLDAVDGACGGGDLGVMPEPEEAKDLPDDGDAKSLCVGANCNGGGGGGGGGKKGAKKEEA